jgi:hypothetical protein
MSKEYNYAVPVRDVFRLAGGNGDRFPKESYGVEIELIGQNLPRPEDWKDRTWVIHADGSLRPGPNEVALEYVTTGALSKEKLREALVAFDAQLKAAGAVLRKTHQTSTHVHVNFIYRSMLEVMNLITLHTILETSLVRSYCGDTRMGNTFCLRLQDAYGGVRFIQEAIQTKQFRAAWRGDGMRYNLLNLQSLPKFGSIEFRGYPGYETAERFFEWVEVISSLVKASEKFTSPAEIVRDFSRKGVRRFLWETFPDNMGLVTTLLRSKTLDKDTDAGVRCAQDIAFADTWTYKKVPENAKSKPLEHNPFVDAESAPTLVENNVQAEALAFIQEEVRRLQGDRFEARWVELPPVQQGPRHDPVDEVGDEPDFGDFDDFDDFGDPTDNEDNF